ncbi:MAG: sodium/substrate symporter small subunit, partial [Rhodospirillaceae bacterium]
MSDKSADAYWQASVKLILTCLAVWFVVSYGFGIILRDALDAIQVG